MGWLVAFLMLLKAAAPLTFIAALLIAVGYFNGWLERRRFVLRAYKRWKRTGEVDPFIFASPKLRDQWRELERIERIEALRLGKLRSVLGLLKKKVWRDPSASPQNWRQVYRRGNITVERPVK